MRALDYKRSRAALGLAAASFLLFLGGGIAPAEEVERFEAVHCFSDIRFEGSAPASNLAFARFGEIALALAPGGRSVKYFEGRFQDDFPASRSRSYDALCVRVTEVPIPSPDGKETALVNLSFVFEEGMQFPSAVFTDPSENWYPPAKSDRPPLDKWERMKSPWRDSLEMPHAPLESSVNAVITKLWESDGYHPKRSGGQLVIRPRSWLTQSARGASGWIKVDEYRVNGWICQIMGVPKIAYGDGRYATQTLSIVEDKGPTPTGSSYWP